MINWKYVFVIMVVALLAEVSFINYNNEQQYEKERLQSQIKQQELEQQKLREQVESQRQEQQSQIKEQERRLQELAAEQEKQRTLQEQSEQEKINGIFDNAKRLYEDYIWKLNLVSEIQGRTDAFGASASRDMYIEWFRRNTEAITAGEALATYITENRDVLDNKGTIKNWASDTLVLVAKNKVTLERDNQALIGIINNMN